MDDNAWILALRETHDHLERAVAALGTEAAAKQSYCSDWSVAQVVSHIGSGAEIFGMALGAALSDAPEITPEQFKEVWARWDAMDPREQIEEGLAFDEELIAALAALHEDRRRTLRIVFHGAEYDVPGFCQLRLSEQALHTWDVAVVSDPTVQVPAAAVALLVDSFEATAGYAAKPLELPVDAVIATTEPDRVLHVRVSKDGTQIRSAAPDQRAMLRLPAEGFLRLITGRLDNDHDDGVQGDEATLADLRSVFHDF